MSYATCTCDHCATWRAAVDACNEATRARASGMPIDEIKATLDALPQEVRDVIASLFEDADDEMLELQEIIDDALVDHFEAEAELEPKN